MSRQAIPHRPVTARPSRTRRLATIVLVQMALLSLAVSARGDDDLPAPKDVQGFIEKGNSSLANKDFDKAIAEFALTYADQNERDFKALLKAIQDGRIQVSQE